MKWTILDKFGYKIAILEHYILLTLLFLQSKVLFDVKV